MRKIGFILTGLIILLFLFSITHDFSRGDSIYCATAWEMYDVQGFYCSRHANAFLSATLGDSGTYFFTLSLFLICLIFFNHQPYLRPEEWIRTNDKRLKRILKNTVASSLSLSLFFYFAHALPSLILGFSFTLEPQLFIYLTFLFLYIIMTHLQFHVVYALSHQPVVALFSFFLINSFFYFVIDEIAWNLNPTMIEIGSVSHFLPAQDPFIWQASVLFVTLNLTLILLIFPYIIRKKEILT